MSRPTPLPRSTPEAEGVSSRAILDFVNAADARLGGLHSIMILRHGRVIAEGWWHPYGPQHPHSMFSVSKSVTAIAVGLAVADGVVGLDDLVVDHLPDDAPLTPPPGLATLSIRHLLTMTTGHTVDVVFAIDPATTDPWATAMMAHPTEFEPGGSFGYNSAASYLLSAIVQRLTGQRMLDYLNERVLEPIGIVDATWETSPQGIDAGGWGLAITTEDLARFARLCLQRGQWNGRQLVPAEWIDEATASHVDTSHLDHKLDGLHGYGYHFWRNSVGGYRADGAFGQHGIVLPELDAVIAVTGGVQEGQDIFDLAWEHLLPAFGNDTLPDSPELDTLRTRLGSLEVPVVEGAVGSPTGDRVLGIRWLFEDPEIAAVTLQQDSVAITRGEAEQVLPFGHGEWVITDAARMAACGAWVGPETFQLRICLYETPFIQTHTLTFDGEAVVLTIETNVSFDENERPRVLHGSPSPVPNEGV